MTLMMHDKAGYTQGNVWVSGQHEHLLHVAANGAVTVKDTLELGLPLGLEADISPFVARDALTLEPGGGLVLYTDGITEAENAAGKMYGLERLQQVVTHAWQQPAQGVLEALLEDVHGFIGNNASSNASNNAGSNTGNNAVLDDITAVVVKQR